MSKYICQKCGFIHEGSMPDGYFCPICRGSIFDFTLISEEEKVFNRISTDNSVCINRIEEKCINCGVCAKTCENIVGIKQDENKICIGCGQCILTCPMASLIPKYDYLDVLDKIKDSTKKVIAITSPAVRVSLGDAFNLEPGAFLEKKMVGALKALGFDYVFDTAFGADLTSMEEAYELINRIENNGKLPMFSSCCPSWVMYAKNYLKKIVPNLSSCKTPIGMISSIIKKYYAKEEGLNYADLIIVAITPCTSKKEEIIGSDTDYVITTSELANMIRENLPSFDDIKEENFDEFTGSTSGVVFGASGGVCLSVLRIIFNYYTNRDLTSRELFIKEHEYFKEYRIKLPKRVIKCAVVSTMPNLVKLLVNCDDYDFIEVMNCANGCISGGGQILVSPGQLKSISENRKTSLEKNDKTKKNSYPYKNPIVRELYEDYLEHPGSKIAKKLLHNEK